MDARQNTANEIEEIDKAVKASQPVVLSLQQQAWIDYNAMSGIVTDLTEDKPIRKITISEFAKMLDVNRDTLRRWRNEIPDFWERVNKRRQELAPTSRLQKMHETWYLKAAKFENWPITEAWLRNFDPEYKEPRAKVEHEMGDSWAALIRSKKQIIEGETSEATDDQSS